MLFGESMRFEHLIVNYLLPAIKNANEMLQGNNNNIELGAGFRDIDAIVPTWHHPIPLLVFEILFTFSIHSGI